VQFVLARILQASNRRHIAILLGGIVFAIVAGGSAFAATQHLPFTTGIYWAITTATTVGYGDVIPKNPTGRVIASIVMLTTIPMLAGVFALFTGQAVSNRVRRILQMSTSRFPEGPYRLVIGMHPSVPKMIQELRRAGDAAVLVADIEPNAVPHGVHLIRGDPTLPDVLRQANPAGAEHALICGTSDGDVLVIAVLLREQAPNLPITALASSVTVAEALRELGVAHVVSSEDIVAHTLAKSLEAPHAGDLLLRLIVSDGHQLVERKVAVGTPTRPLSACRNEAEHLVLGMVHEGKVSLGVGEDPDVVPGDLLLIVETNHAHSAHSARNDAGS
jgi:voltage-gated potassium channel